MRLGLMQPYFFPYIEYFRLISQCDLWISFDTAQFSRGSWMNRNRIMEPNKGWTYVGLPICRDGLHTPLNQARIDPKRDWQRDFRNKLNVYKGNAPNYNSIYSLINDVIQAPINILSEMNFHCVTKLCTYLNIDTKLMKLSTMGITGPEVGEIGGWPLYLCRVLGATEYLNASGGQSLYNPEDFEAAGVKLKFLNHANLIYDTGKFEFVPNLSIIDPLMWVSYSGLCSIVHD